MVDTHKLRAFAAALARDGYASDYVRMIEDAADEIEKTREDRREDRLERRAR